MDQLAFDARLLQRPAQGPMAEVSACLDEKEEGDFGCEPATRFLCAVRREHPMTEVANDRRHGPAGELNTGPPAQPCSEDLTTLTVALLDVVSLEIYDPRCHLHDQTIDHESKTCLDLPFGAFGFVHYLSGMAFQSHANRDQEGLADLELDGPHWVLVMTAETSAKTFPRLDLELTCPGESRRLH